MTGLAPPLQEVVERVRQCCTESTPGVWWVGGTVRDALLGVPPHRFELDAAVEREPSPLVHCLTQRGAVVRRTSQFGTLAIEFSQGGRVDLAMTRKDSYFRPGALPVVEPAPLLEDLARRDFSVNAIALPIGGGDLVDPMDGQGDLTRGLLRVLYQRSFEDDPTRVLRGVRFGSRWGFGFEHDTDRAARQAIAGGGLCTLSADRLRRELERAGSEPRLSPVVLKWQEIGVWRSVFDSCPLPRERLERWDARTERLPPTSLSYWMLLFSRANEDDLRAVGGRLRLPLGDLEAICQGRRWLLRWEENGTLPAIPDASALEEWCELDKDIRQALWSTSSWIGQAWSDRLSRAASVVLAIGGAQLLAAGVRAGPAVGLALRAALAARRRGEIAAGQELEFALRSAGRSTDG